MAISSDDLTLVRHTLKHINIGEPDIFLQNHSNHILLACKVLFSHPLLRMLRTILFGRVHILYVNNEYEKRGAMRMFVIHTRNAR